MNMKGNCCFVSFLRESFEPTLSVMSILVGDKSKDGEKKKVSEPSFEMLSNPARVMKQQLNVVTMVDGSKYIPVKDIKIGKSI